MAPDRGVITIPFSRRRAAWLRQLRERIDAEVRELELAEAHLGVPAGHISLRAAISVALGVGR